ncbi:ribonuclease P protein subunit [Candidatus Woesearchaeota archaeon]|nr:ribonuclease P protein subunit [Candidatus Woesearchaeota archaeon]
MNELKREYIGLNITIIESKNQSLTGLKGKVIDETKNTFKINTKKGTKTILKNSSKFKINNEIIDGNKITKKPQDRIKMKGGR